MDSSALPQEIFLLLCEELAARRDFRTLFNCALVSRRIASIALEQIYRIQEYSPVSTGYPVYMSECLQLWRSIILSSIKKTVYPYCIYVRSLSFGNLEDCLQDIDRDNHARDMFLEGPMEQFLVLQKGQGLYAEAEDARPPSIDIKATMVKCADSITKCIKRLADDMGTAVSLAHLEGTSIPYDILPTWISRIGTLTSLRIRDGSVLGVEAARAISEYCPSFVDLTCFYCMSSVAPGPYYPFNERPSQKCSVLVYEDSANNLRSFEVISQNSIGKIALTALNSHAASLRSLVLRNLTPPAMQALNSFPACTSLEKLLIENDLYNLVDLSKYPDNMVNEVSTWICKCKSLRDLSFSHVIGFHPVIKDVLNSPDIRLTSLSILSIHSGTEPEDTATWTALGLQEHLESLTLGLHDSAAYLLMEAKPPLVDSICQLTNMASLNLMQVHLTKEEVGRIAAALPNLSEFSFSGELSDDDVLVPLSNIPKLKVLCINSITRFSFDALYEFGYALMIPDRTGIKVDILNQLSEYKFSESEYDRLQNHFIKHPKGRLEIVYFMDPDELHETDFSDFSD
ncbi:uncharacterized protein F4812DRAFT_466681 [Daldinia caldariorum]|uniref:uncharacterized protein n=1 Tax=Daldinia caldariorum TaxID=326644 RepID=UPI0020082791|nr:uncharacterized protein F4812DRAFT_466681 [Daldinia caldariorum]KAI1465239.1 hypothetical protein F4812DRAFT_466681 [Daldinia caldariorum]